MQADPLFDPAVFVVLPGTTNVATTRDTLAPCPKCNATIFEVVREPSGRTSCQCPRCCKRNGKLLGVLSMTSGKGKAVR